MAHRDSCACKECTNLPNTLVLGQRAEVLQKLVSREAVQVQDACNVRAVARLLVDSLAELDERALVGGTDALCAHPVTRALVDKLASLCGVQDVGNHAALRAHAECSAMAEEHVCDGTGSSCPKCIVGQGCRYYGG